MKAKKYPSPQLFRPSKEDSLRVLKEVSKGFSDDKVLTSSTYPDLKERGKQTYSRDKESKPPIFSLMPKKEGRQN